MNEWPDSCSLIAMQGIGLYVEGVKYVPGH